MSGTLATVKAGDIYSEADYRAAYEHRITLLENVRKSDKNRDGAIEHYRHHPHDLITDFMDTYDPRRLATGDSPVIPFMLFPRQTELIDFIRACMADSSNGLIEKSRDTGCTFIAGAVAIWLLLFHSGSAIGFGSLKAEKVDRIGDMDSIFEKLRFMVRGLPSDFLPRDIEKNMSYMKIVNPANGASITGECGDNVGRGGRKLIYFVDEAAWLEHPEMADAALGDNTRCRIDISSVSGIGTPFHRKRESGEIWEPGGELSKVRTNIFIFDWTHHPAKTEKWYDQRKAQAESGGILHVFAQEIDRDYFASLPMTIIKREWVRAAVDLHHEIPELEDGGEIGGFDVADEGGDLHAFARRKGLTLKYLREWGQGDVGNATRSVIGGLNGSKQINIQYDCIGVGAGAKSEYNRLLEAKELPDGIIFTPWNAGASVMNPHQNVISGDRESMKNKDFYQNLKAQAWWSVRNRLERCWKYRLYLSGKENGAFYEPSQLMSIDSNIGKGILSAIESQLCQVQSKQSVTLKTMIDKMPEGSRSPNAADAVVMCYFPVRLQRRRGISVIAPQVISNR